jgi:hypothetical protein
MTTCVDVWYIHHSYNIYLIRQGGFTNLTHVDIQGEPGDDPGVQQQQGSVQEIWGESRWEEIAHVPRQKEFDLATPPTRHRMHQEQRRHNAQQGGHYQNTTTSSTLVRRNLASHLQGASICRADLIPMDKQLQAATMHYARPFSSTTAEGEGFCATVEEVHATRTNEEEMVQELLNGWQKRAHGYIPEVKDDNVIRLGCENVNSLSIFHPTKSKKMRKLTHLHQRHQTDRACIVEHGINFKMAATGTRPEDLFPGMCSSRVSAGHNKHELHNCYQQGGTMMVAFSRLACYVLSSRVDQTGLGCWSWIQVGTGEYWTQIVSVYHPCHSSGWQLISHNGLMKGRGTVAAQHERYFRKKCNFNKPREIFSSQLITQLMAWHAVGEEVILFIDVNENICTSPLAKDLRGNGLQMEEQTLRSTGKEAPHSHCTGKVAIVGTYATPGIICTNSYLSPHGAGVGNHRFKLHNFDAHTVLGTDYPNSLSSRKVTSLQSGTHSETVNKVLTKLLIHHRLFEKLKFLQTNHHLMSADAFQTLFNRWDTEVMQLMLALEKRRNKFCDGSIVFSPRLGNPFEIPRNSAIIPMLDLLDSGIFIGILFFRS